MTVVAMASCRPSPTSIVAGPDGRQVEVDWADYPAAAGLDADTVLAAASTEEMGPRTDAMLAAARTAITPQLPDPANPRWSSTGRPEVFDLSGNQYGGESLLRQYIAAPWTTPVVVPRERLATMQADLTRTLGSWGLRPVAFADGSTASGNFSFLGDWSNGVEGLTVIVSEHETPVGPAGVRLEHLATTLPGDRRAAFVDRARPFAGLPLPEPVSFD